MNPRALFVYLLSILLFLTISSINAVNSSQDAWQGKTLKFYITNNTNKILFIGPAWDAGAETIPQFLFPKGNKIAPYSTSYYSIKAHKYLQRSKLGKLITGVFLSQKDPLVEICDSNIKLNENKDGILSLSNYSFDGLYVGTKTSKFSCTGTSTDFVHGCLHLIVSNIIGKKGNK